MAFHVIHKQDSTKHHTINMAMRYIMQRKQQQQPTLAICEQGKFAGKLLGFQQQHGFINNMQIEISKCPESKIKHTNSINKHQAT
jgi:hypothetical protein